ncbi:MAG: hypothetical protein HC927_01200 [Deltaproteobacteria bacterium]|nr:hypothetical protein [Deltaproteobacteria bacterium]
MLTIDVHDLDLSRIRKRKGDFTGAELEAALGVDKVAHQICGPLRGEAGDRPTVVFMPTVGAARQLSEVLGGYVPARQVAMVHGGTDDHVRRTLTERFAAGDLQFLVNCMVLTEGWDAPNVGCIAICRPTKSRSLLMQMIGRGLRPIRREDGSIDHDAKTDCLILDFVGNSEGHDLATPLAALAGSDLPEKDLVLLESAMRADERAKDALEKGDLEALKALALEYSEIEAQREDALRYTRLVFAEVSYDAKEVDPLVVRRLGKTGARKESIREVHRLGVPLPKIRDGKHAEQIVDFYRRREREGLATYRQSAFLKRYGLTTSVTKKEARDIMHAIKDNGWKPPASIYAKYGQRPKR